MVGNVVGCRRVGTDGVHGEHFQVLHLSSFALGRARNVAACTVLGEQRATLRRQRFVDCPQQIFRPDRWRESLQGFFDQVQIAYANAGGITRFAHQRLAVLVEEIQRGADT
ncbi:hypothetical protein D3C76_1126010 [compost metagenome]